MFNFLEKISKRYVHFISPLLYRHETVEINGKRINKIYCKICGKEKGWTYHRYSTGKTDKCCILHTILVWIEGFLWHLSYWWIIPFGWKRQLREKYKRWKKFKLMKIRYKDGYPKYTLFQKLLRL